MAGTVTSRDGMSTLVLVLSPEDINAIKCFASLGLNTTTFLSIDSSAVTDLAIRPNPVATLPPESAIPVVTYEADTTGPILLDFTLDINMDFLTLTFNEVVRKSSLNFTNVVLYPTNSSENQNDFAMALTEGSFLQPDCFITTDVRHGTFGIVA